MNDNSLYAQIRQKRKSVSDRLAKLDEEKRTLQAKLAVYDELIQNSLEATILIPPNGPGAQQPSLPGAGKYMNMRPSDAILDILTCAKGAPLRVKEIVMILRREGVKSEATKFDATVRSILGRLVISNRAVQSKTMDGQASFTIKKDNDEEKA